MNGKHNIRPPRWANRLLRRHQTKETRQPLLDDLQECYSEKVRDRGRLRADLWYQAQALKILSGRCFNHIYWSVPMLSNYSKTAFRNMKRRKGFTLINVSGLAIGMAACLTMLMFVIHETGFDRFHENKDRIYRVIAEWSSSGSGNRMRFAGSMPAVAPALGEVPEVEAAARVQTLYEGVVSLDSDTEIQMEHVHFADPGIFNILSWHLVQGDPNTVLTGPFTAVLSERMVARHFPEGEPLGKTITIDDQPYTIQGVMRDVPESTHLPCDMALSYASIEALGRTPSTPWNSWGSDYNYLLLREGVSADAVGEKLNELLTQNSGEWFAKMMTLIVQPLKEIHWDTQSRADTGPKGNRVYVLIFSSAALLVLLIACFNFMNLSTARYLERMKEVGIRKVVGAGRRQLIYQFLSESILLFFGATLLAFLLFAWLGSSIYAYLGAEVVLGAGYFRTAVGIVLLFVLVLGILAGLYPALFLSRFRPVEIMKKAVDTKRLSFRPAAAIMQYAVTTILIIGTLVIYRQLDFMKHTELGFDKEDAVLLRFPFNNEEAASKYPVLKGALLNHAEVTSVSGAYTVPGVNSQFQMSVRKPGAETEDRITYQALPGDFGLIESLGLQVVQGRDFSREFATDDNAAVILNEAAVRVLGFDDPLGQKLIFPRNGEQNIESVVVGIVKDFHVKSLHEEIGAMLLFIDPHMFGTMIVKLRPEHPNALAFIEQTWRDVLPFAEYDMQFMEDAYYRFYATEEKTGKLVTVFACLAGFVSCLGLFGLAAFTASKRIKEIGIRKVLGASAGGVTFLLSRQFTRWVLVSNLIAWPAAYFIFTRWLDHFAYRIDLDVGIFLLSGLLAWIISLLTVGYHALKAATSNPVESLRYE